MTDRVIRVIVDPSGVSRGTDQAKRKLGGLQQTFKAAAAAATAFAAVLGAREVLQAADSYQNLQNRLRIVTDSTEELAEVTERLFAISQDTRQPLEATAGLYGSAAIAADELGASQEQLLRLTEITGKALAIQGSSSAEAAGALRQLSQSFSSGIVRAEEFNSILEGAFPIAQAAARGIDAAGGSVGRLRQLVVDGEISSREFFEAILEGGAGIDDQFGQTELTLSQATTKIQNSFLSLVGRLNETSGAGAGLAEALDNVSGFIDDLADALTGTLEPGQEVSDNLKVFASLAIVAGNAVKGFAQIVDATLIESFKALGETIGATAAGLVALLSGEFAQAGAIFDELGANLAKRFADSVETLNEDLISNSLETLNKLDELWNDTARNIVETTKNANKETGDNPPVNPNTAESINEAGAAATDYIETLKIATEELRIQAEAGDDAVNAVRRYREAIEVASAANEIYGELIPTEQTEAFRAAFVQAAEEQLAAQQALREEIENESIRQSFDEQIEALEEEILLLDADSEAIARNAEVRALAEGATAEQAARIRELTEELENQREAQENATNNLDDFFEGAKSSAESNLAGLLSDPLNQDLDDVAAKFSATLADLAAEALASEIFGLFTGGAGGAGGAGGGGIGGIIGSFFGGGFAAGGEVRGGQPILVGERGPEIFTPPGSGAITPNVNINQAAQAPPTVVVNNVTDPADVPAGLRTTAAQEEVLNIIQRNPDAVKRVLG